MAEPAEEHASHGQSGNLLNIVIPIADVVKATGLSEELLLSL